ncbi:hypothetical protein C8034_v003168 [Colletotrichum sidae]|uniref:Uncharacterized protein n=1 Tax=Colletotrichum sidae TaxID=1347389 RepID=A0A4R8TA97_9PEZI|nr:hypothetical protein C8034_v003168 [Colletotrichum sidae]
MRRLEEALEQLTLHELPKALQEAVICPTPKLPLIYPVAKAIAIQLVADAKMRKQFKLNMTILSAMLRTFVKQPTETERRGPTSEISSTGIQARKSFLSLGDNVAQYWQLDDDMPGDGDHVVRDRVSDYPRYDNHLEGGFFFRNNELARQESGHEICSAHAYENPRGYNKATALPPESIADYISSAEREILGADYDVYIQGGPDYQGSCEQHGEHADVPDVHG